MATARWFFQSEPDSRFVIQEHLRQDFWRAGPAALWIEVVKSTSPFLAAGYWHDVTFDLEWESQTVVRLRASRQEPELIRALTLQLGFKPTHQGEEQGKHLAEWRLRQQAVAAPPTSLAATSVVGTHGDS